MKLNDIDLNKLVVFCRVVESGNYQRASETLHVTPSALSQAIKGLEGSLGFRLFDRIGRGLVPTKQALRLHREFRGHEEGLARLIGSLKGARAEVAGTLRVGAYLEFAKSQLSAPLKSFVQRFPQAQVKMVFEPPTRLHSLLRQGQLDLCFSIFPSQEKKAISSERIYEEELVLVAAPHLLPEPPSYEQVLGAPMIEYYSNHQPILRWLALHYQRRPKKAPARIHASTAEMVLSLATEGAGIGVVPAYVAAQAGKRARIIRPTPRRLKDFIWLLESSGTEHSPLHIAFREELARHFRPA